YRKAANQGDMYAQYNLGRYYENGCGGLPQSMSEAFTWYRKAAAQGNSDAQKAVQRLESQGYR
ncbi:MAG: sel1 repeat family protein, partial [Muribaculaceae bacterium]